MRSLRSLFRLLSFVWLVLVFVHATSTSAMEWKSSQLGNIFEVNQAVEISLQVDADSVDWKITDFWHSDVEAGAGLITGGQIVIRPKVRAVGYYLLHATPKKGGAPRPDGYTSFAIVRPHVSKDPLASPFGVMTHFAQGMNPEMLPVFKKVGIESIRDEHYWGQVEKTKGVYEFPDRSNAYMKACEQAGIHPLVAMTFGNKLYDDKDGPTTPAGFEAYGRYGQAILKQYGPEIHWLEIWNEYNGTWAPPSAKKSLEARYTTYTAMLKTAYQEIKAVRPDTQVLGGAAVLIPLPYFEGIFKLDGLKYMDGVVIHPYRGKPEGVDKEVEELKELIRKYNGGKDKPIWATETGRQSKDEYDWETGRKMYEKGRAEGARYLARQYTLLLKENVAKIYWYLASDHAEFVSMGLLRHHEKEASGMGRYAVAPAFVSYANLIHQLDGAQFVRSEPLGEYSQANVMLFRRGDEEVRVCWATQPAKIRVAASQPLKVANLMGTESTLTPKNGGMNLDLTADAIYLQGKVTSVTEVDTGTRVVAASVGDYSKTQGEKNWYYGYYDTDGQFQELKQMENMWGYYWGGVGRYLALSEAGTHPDKAGDKDLPSVRRWKSPIEGKIEIKAVWSNGGKGDGITAAILADGQEISTQPVGGSSPKNATVNVSTTVKKGSTIDFVCRPNANTAFDASGCEIVISQRK
jgi:hypothetical protein